MSAGSVANRKEERGPAPVALPASDSNRLRRARVPDSLVAASMGLIALFVYCRTLYPAIAWGDSPELTAAAYQAGVPHPTGYPLYMLLAHSFLRVFPLGSIAYRMNLLSALSAAAAVALMYPLTRRLTGSRGAGVTAALLLAFSATFWSQAVLAEVYAFHMLLITAVLGAVIRWEASEDRRWLWAAAVLYGLCFAHHMMSVLLAPGLLFFALTSPRRSQFLRELPRTVPLFLLPLLLYLYLPWAAMHDPAMNWGDPRSWHNFLAHVTGREYQARMFELSARQHGQLLARYFGGVGERGLLWAQFTPQLLWLAPLGLWRLGSSHRRLLGLTLLIYLVTAGYALNYYIFDVDVYYLPAHLTVAIWIAAGVCQMGRWLEQLGRRWTAGHAGARLLPDLLLGAAALAMPLWLLECNWKPNDHHEDRSALIYARAALTALKPGAVLLSGDDNFHFPVMYTHYVERRRPDVTLIALHDVLRPECLRLLTRLTGEGLAVRVRRPGPGEPWGDREYRQLLTRLIGDNVSRRPFYLLLPPDTLEVPWLAASIAPYYRITRSNMPVIELCRQAPSLSGSDTHVGPRAPLPFGQPRSDGQAGDDLELTACDVKSQWKEGLPWQQVSYRWRIRNPAIARQATVWVLFTTADGRYLKMPDGSPEFNNIHPLAYGLGRQQYPLPRVLQETYTLYVPPRQWGTRLRIRMAVAVGGRLLSCGTGGGPWADLGELPPAPPAAP